MFGLLLSCLSLSAVEGQGEAACGIKHFPCERAAISSEGVTMVPTQPEWDDPIRVIYESHLAPLFAACHCPFYGIEETESWNDPDTPGLRWWQVTVVLGVFAEAGWEMRGREYLFQAKGAERPHLATLGPEYAWPSTPVLVH
ncbi:MAG: hypothetical protein FJ245_13190 [Nitrospira sp.]|nr:hypothetical protein [Nitrospira sp.]